MRAPSFSSRTVAILDWAGMTRSGPPERRDLAYPAIRQPPRVQFHRSNEFVTSLSRAGESIAEKLLRPREQGGTGTNQSHRTLPRDYRLPKSSAQVT